MSRNAEGPEAQIDVGDLNLNCNVHDTFVAVSSLLFVLCLALKAKKNINSLCNGGSYIIASCYALLWIVTLLNLAWSFLQVHHYYLYLSNGANFNCLGDKVDVMYSTKI